MNDQTKQEFKTELIDPNKVVGGFTSVSADFGGLKIQNMAEVVDMAKLMAKSAEAVPPHLRDKPGACWAICLCAIEWKMSPFAVANKSYVVEDRLSYESQLIHAVIEARAPLKERLKVRYEGEGEDRICIVYGTFRGESEPREHRSPRLADVRPPYGDKRDAAGKPKRKGSPLWDKKPDVQLFYDTSRDFCRIYCPDVLLGIYTPDEVEQYGIGDTARDITTSGATLHDRLKASSAVKHGEGFRPGVVDAGLNGEEPPWEQEQAAYTGPGEAAGEPVTGGAPKEGSAPAGAQATVTKRRGRPPGPRKAKAEETALEPTRPADGHADLPDDGVERRDVHQEPSAVDDGIPEILRRAQPGPSNSAEYIAHAESYIITATDVAALETQWKSERDLRGTCSVVEDDFVKIRGRYTAKLAALRDEAAEAVK